MDLNFTLNFTDEEMAPIVDPFERFIISKIPDARIYDLREKQENESSPFVPEHRISRELLLIEVLDGYRFIKRNSAIAQGNASYGLMALGMVGLFALLLLLLLIIYYIN